MSEFKGTKGNAKVFNECFKNKYDFYVQPISISSSNKILFANAYGETKEQAEANAKLIACASETLEMLETAIWLLKQTTEYEVLESYRIKVLEFEKTIKKATE